VNTLAFGENFSPSLFLSTPWLKLLLLRFPLALAPALFTWFIPDLLRYRKGGMAKFGAAVSISLLALQTIEWAIPGQSLPYLYLHRALFGVLFAYAILGAALVYVGLYDKKRSAIWALLAVLCLSLGALGDAAIWLGVASGPPLVPWGFAGFVLFLLGGYIRRYADPLPALDLRQAAQISANNLTRKSASIPRKLLREGRLHLLPVFYIMTLSDMGREGIMNSGSHEFADHIYRSEPSGRTALGRRIDAHLLGMPAARAFRLRYKKAQEEVHRALLSFDRSTTPLNVLALPCGLPRDMTELAENLYNRNPSLLARIHYTGMDVDPLLITKARRMTDNSYLANTRYHQGNALLRDEYPQGPFHAAISTGLGEFLDDEQLATLYANVHASLVPGGTFYTSATALEPRSERLLRAFELDTHYRTPARLESILRQTPWTRLVITVDETGLQSFVVAVK
jgi:hypothetical protein